MEIEKEYVFRVRQVYTDDSSRFFKNGKLYSRVGTARGQASRLQKTAESYRKWYEKNPERASPTNRLVRTEVVPYILRELGSGDNDKAQYPDDGKYTYEVKN